MCIVRAVNHMLCLGCGVLGEWIWGSPVSEHQAPPPKTQEEVIPTSVWRIA